MNKIKANNLNVKAPNLSSKGHDATRSSDRKKGAPVEPSDSFTSSRSDKPRKTRLIILHTNDLHGRAEAFTEISDKTDRIGGLSYVGGIIETEKGKNPDNTVILDAGDITSGSPVSDLFGTLPMVEAMNRMGYDAMTMGNHEVDLGLDVLKNVVQKAEFPVLSANIIQNDNKDRIPFKPYIFKNIDGIKVGILGLTTPSTKIQLRKKDEGKLSFGSAEVFASHLVPKMKQKGADVVILLSHLGHEQDRKLAGSVKGIDLIIGGHSHKRLERLEKVNDTYIAQAGCFGKDVGKVDMILEWGGDEKPRVTAARSKLIPVNTKEVKPDKEISEIVNKYVRQIAPVMNEKIGYAGEPIAQRDYHVYKEESPLGNFITDTIRESLKTDIVIIANSSFRSNIPSGDVTVGKIYEVFPWDSEITILEMKGKDIKKGLEQFIGGDPYCFSASGLKVEVDTTRPPGQQILDIKTADGKPFDENKTYKVATRDKYAHGAFGLKAFTRYSSQKNTGVYVKGLIINSIRNKGRLTARRDGRFINRQKYE